MTLYTHMPGKTFKNVVFNDDTIEHREYLLDMVFDNCVFDDITLSENTFTQCKFYKCSFKSTYIWENTFTECSFTECDFSESVWTTAKLEECVLEGCNFHEIMHMIEVEFDDCKITDCNFTDTININNEVRVIKSYITSTIFDNYLIEKFEFEDCKLIAVTFDNSDLNEVHFINCVLSWCIFNNNNLSDVIFENTTFKNSKFSLAKFDKTVKMRNISLVDTIFTQCEIPLSITEGITIEPTTSTNKSKSNKSNHYTHKNGRQVCLPPPKPKEVIPTKSKKRAYRFYTNGV